MTRAAMMQVTTSQNSAALYQMRGLWRAEATAIFSAHAARSGSARRSGALSLLWSVAGLMAPEFAAKPRRFKETTLQIALTSWTFVSRRSHGAASFSGACDFRLDPGRDLSLI